MDNQAIYDLMIKLDRKFTTFAQQAGYEFDAEGNATRVGKPSQVAVVASVASKVPKGLDGSLDEVDIFEFWCSVMEKNAATQYTKERKKSVKARLEDGYSVDYIKTAITGCSKTPHNMGNNDNGKLYNDLELICRKATDLERFHQNDTDTKPMASADPNKKVRHSFMALGRGDHLDGEAKSHNGVPVIESSDSRVISNQSAMSEFALLEQQHRTGG